MIGNPYIKACHKPRTPEDWVRFAWEEDKALEAAKEGAYTITDQQIAILDKIREDYYNGKDRGAVGKVKS